GVVGAGVDADVEGAPVDGAAVDADGAGVDAVEAIRAVAEIFGAWSEADALTAAVAATAVAVTGFGASLSVAVTSVDGKATGVAIASCIGAGFATRFGDSGRKLA